MEILLLGIYSIFVWLIFIKFKWLPWNITSQVIVVTIPIIALTLLILFLNIVAPSSSDVRVINYVVQVVPRISGRVVEVPVDPNRPVKKGDVLFKIDPTPIELEIQQLEAKIAGLSAKVVDTHSQEREMKDKLKSATANKQQSAAKLVSTQAYQRELEQQLRSAAGKKTAITAKLELARKRMGQAAELAAAGAGPGYDLEQATAEVESLESELEAATAVESQVAQKLSAKVPSGEFADIARVRAEIAGAAADESQVAQRLSARTTIGDLAEVAEAKAEMQQAEAQLADARWRLDQTVTYAPADGSVINLQLRPGSYASAIALSPVMSFVENEQWVVAFYHQNELRKVGQGNEAEVTLETYPNQIIKCKVDSIVWANGQGQSPISGMLPQTGSAPQPEGRFAVRLMPDGPDKDLFLAPGARGTGAVYTDSGHMIHIIRKVLLRVHTKLDWLILKLH
jgi:multidrug resistance efflux pump